METQTIQSSEEKQTIQSSEENRQYSRQRKTENTVIRGKQKIQSSEENRLIRGKTDNTVIRVKTDNTVIRGKQTGLYRICFIQGSVQTGLYRILFYSGFGSDRFIEDSVLLTDREGQRIQCPKEKLQNTKNKQIVHGTKGHLA